MKKFRLILATVLVFVLTFALTACSSPVVGEWELAEIKYGGIVMSPDDFEEQTGMTLDMTFDIKADGTFEGQEVGAGTTMDWEGEWEFEDDELTLKPDNTPSKTIFEYKDGELILDQGEVCFILKKK